MKKQKKKLTIKQQEQRNKVKTILKWVLAGLGWSLLAFGFISLLVIGVRGCSNKKQVKANAITTPVLFNRNNDMPNNIIMNYDQAIGTYVDLDYNNSVYNRLEYVCGYRAVDRTEAENISGHLGGFSYASYYYNFFLNEALSFPYVNNITSQRIGFYSYNYSPELQFNGYNGTSKAIMRIELVYSTLDNNYQVLNNATYLYDQVSGFFITQDELLIYDQDDGTIHYNLNLLNGVGLDAGGNNHYFITQFRMWFIADRTRCFSPSMSPVDNINLGLDDSWCFNITWYEGSAGVSIDNWVNQNGFERSIHWRGQYGFGNPLDDSGGSDNNNNPGGVGGTSDNGLDGVFNLISRAFGAMYNIFAIPVIPGITLGTFIALPLIAMFIFFLVWLFKR